MATKRALRSVNTDSEKRVEMIHNLDIGYQKTSHRAELIVKDEEARRLKLRGLLLRDENSAINDTLAQKEEIIKKLLAQHEGIQEQLHSTSEKARQQELRMRSQARELTNLKEEMDSLADMNKDSAKLRTEKLALSRELDVLKPELEHLKSQLSHQKTVLAEKLALERQINALEVELANEKRAAERLQGRDKDVEDSLRQQIRELEKQLAKEKRAAEKAAQHGQNDTSAELEQEIAELRSQLGATEKKLLAAEKQMRADAKASKAKGAASEVVVTEELEQLRLELAETKKELADEKKDKERIRREGEKALAEAEGLRLALEERIDNLKAKLREAREQLKECRADLERAQEAARTAATRTATTTKVPTKKAAAAKLAPAGKKRRANDISGPEISVLQTPGKDDDRPRRTFKKPFAPAAVGEKSTFSITPFLNKTINLSDASLLPITEDESEEQDNKTATTEPTGPTESPTRLAGRKKKPSSSNTKAKAALTESSPSKHNMPTSKSREAPSAESTLDKVTEEVEEAADQENQAPAPIVKQRKRMVLKNKTVTPVPADARAIDADAGTSTTVAAPSKVTSLSTSTAAPAVAEPKKKKRKLLGGASTNVLFDGAADAEDAAVPVPAAAPVAAPAKRIPMGKVALGGHAGLAAKKAGGLGVKNAFAAASFSPLKRDRRGVGASFLA